ncbi:MAG: peptidoglycan D,D-transpeptidase FtsI family protein [Candidatus Saccharimonadales bacterium]
MVLVIIAIFIVRLFYLQVIRHDYYVAQARSEQLKQLDIPAKRGEIYAMDGSVPTKMVLNETVYTVFADPVTVDKPAQVADLIRRIAGGNARPNLESMLANKKSRYQILATNVTLQQATMMKDAQLSGLGFQRENQRVYPNGQLAAQTLGFVDNSGQGQYGIEGAMNAQLAGTDGLLQTVTDVRNVPLTIGNNNIKKPAVNGQNIVMTLDQNVQSYTEQALANGLKKSGATHGSVVVMDPQTGKIMAMANLPTFNPSNYSQVSDIADYNNATISAPYEAGSVVKSLTVSTGLDKGVIQPDSTFNNTGSIQVDDATINNASTTEALGTQTMQTALTDSLNTGMVTVAERLGNGQYITQSARNTIYDYFHNRFGFGQLTGIELSGESPGIIIPPNTVQGNAVRYSNMVFGQGMDITMLQMSAAFSSIINGGIYHDPTILAGTIDDNGSFHQNAARPSHQVVQASTSQQIKNMLQIDRHGNGAVDPAGYSIGGKTGTSQALINGVYSFTQTIGTYIGFGGDSTARYVIMVQVSGDHMNLGGAQDASPIFGDISNWMLGYLKLHPKG